MSKKKKNAKQKNKANNKDNLKKSSNSTPSPNNNINNKISNNTNSNTKSVKTDKSKDKIENKVKNKVESKNNIIDSTTTSKSENDKSKNNIDKPTKKNTKKILIVGSLIILVTGSTSTLLLHASKMKDLTYRGLLIDDVGIGNLNSAQLSKTLATILHDKLENMKINIIYDGKTTSITPEELGVSYDIAKIVDDSINFNKDGNLIENTINMVSLQFNPKSVNYKAIYDEELLNKFIDKTISKYNIEPTNANITFEANSITAKEGKNGIYIDKDKFYNDLIDCIDSNFNDTLNIQLDTKTVKPTLTKDVAESLQVLGTFKTKLPSTTGDRTGNIKLYSSKINKAVILPGEEFSCDEFGGSRTWADGYRNAPGFVNGQVVPILAGGICQATTTIYNALLYADLEITERSPHSMPVSYAKIGLDAAIAKDIKDLKFRNNTNAPIVMQTYVSSDGYMVATVWGIPTQANKEIKLTTVRHNSKAADAYKHTYIDGKLVKKELLSKDRYK